MDLSRPVEEQLAELAAAVGPLRRVLARIAERLVATRAHESLCFARLRDYARERVGLSARQLHDLARVDRALAGLPLLERALVANELPWSKVRLLARVATEEDEAAWIGRARSVATRRLEREVRHRSEEVGPADGGEAGEDVTRVRLRCAPGVREKWVLAREMAERVAGERLCAGDAFERVVAEVFSSVAIEPAFVETLEPAPARRARQSERASADPAPGPRARARELPLAIASLAEGIDAADARELDRRLRRAVRLEQTLDAAMAPLLRVVACAEYEWRGDYQPLARYAPESLGMSARKARALLRLERAGEVCPELREAYRSGRLSWVKASCLLPLFLLDVEGEWRPLWVEWAERVTVRRLERDVERALLLRAGHHRAWWRCKFHPEQAQDPIPEGERQMCAHDVDLEATQELTWTVTREVAALFAGVRETLRAWLQRERGRPVLDGEVFEALLDAALLAWTLRDPQARRPDPVAERDGYRCAVPGCTSRRNLHGHHIRFRSAGGSDDLENEVLLCAFHHQRCLHAGRMRIAGRAPDALVFELALSSVEAPLLRYRSGDVRLADAAEAVGATWMPMAVAGAG